MACASSSMSIGLLQNADGSGYSQWQNAMQEFANHQTLLNVSSYLQVGCLCTRCKPCCLLRLLCGPAQVSSAMRCSLSTQLKLLPLGRPNNLITWPIGWAEHLAIFPACLHALCCCPGMLPAYTSRELLLFGRAVHVHCRAVPEAASASWRFQQKQVQEHA